MLEIWVGWERGEGRQNGWGASVVFTFHEGNTIRKIRRPPNKANTEITRQGLSGPIEHQLWKRL